MDKILFDNIEIMMDADKVAAMAHIRPSSGFYDELVDAVSIAQRLVKPKAVLKKFAVEQADEHSALIGGVRFDGVKLQGKNEVYLYVITAGEALRASGEVEEDLIIYYLESSALEQAHNYVSAYLRETAGCKNTSFFEPGTTEGFAITYNKEIFELIGGVEDAIGVTLKASHFMNPNHTLSGIMFEAE